NQRNKMPGVPIRPGICFSRYLPAPHRLSRRTDQLSIRTTIPPAASARCTKAARPCVGREGGTNQRQLGSNKDLFPSKSPGTPSGRRRCPCGDIANGTSRTSMDNRDSKSSWIREQWRQYEESQTTMAVIFAGIAALFIAGI